MKLFRVIISFIMVLSLVSSCDFFRKLAQRPTSDELEAKRQEKLSAEQVKADALDIFRKQIEDSMRTVFAAEAAGAHKVATAQSAAQTAAQRSYSGASSANINSYRYYICVGAFEILENAQKRAEKARADGYEAALLPYDEFTAVGICPTNDYIDALLARDNVIESGYCSSAWVMYNKNR